MLLEGGCCLLPLLCVLLAALLLPLQRLQLELQLYRHKYGSIVRFWCVAGSEAVEHGLKSAEVSGHNVGAVLG